MRGMPIYAATWCRRAADEAHRWQRQERMAGSLAGHDLLSTSGSVSTGQPAPPCQHADAAAAALETGSAASTGDAGIALCGREKGERHSSGQAGRQAGQAAAHLALSALPPMVINSPPPPHCTSKHTQAPALTWQASWALQPDGHSTAGRRQGVFGQDATPGIRESSLSPEGGRELSRGKPVPGTQLRW